MRDVLSECACGFQACRAAAGLHPWLRDVSATAVLRWWHSSCILWIVAPAQPCKQTTGVLLLMATCSHGLVRLVDACSAGRLPALYEAAVHLFKPGLDDCITGSLSDSVSPAALLHWPSQLVVCHLCMPGLPLPTNACTQCSLTGIRSHRGVVSPQRSMAVFGSCGMCCSDLQQLQLLRPGS